MSIASKTTPPVRHPFGVMARKSEPKAGAAFRNSAAVAAKPPVAGANNKRKF